MPKIIDLGNGYGRLEGYGSLYASLVFPLTLSEVQRLYVDGYLNRDEFIQTLIDMGYTEKAAVWTVTCASVTIAEWKDKLHGLGIV